ncbi:MAG TPA: DUF4178 domain-containing protein [Thermoanaerobaculia bacterium]
MSTANCPSCGGPIEFKIGSSVVIVCNYCRSVVARTDVGYEALGKVAALIDTGSSIRVNEGGRFRGTGFRITGRTQMRHQAGGTWDEWYAAFDDGRWGWLAEAQGRYYMTFQVAAPAPAYEQLQLGDKISLPEDMTVTELGEAALASAEGEIPWRPTPGDTYEYADLSGPEKRFATIDYSEEKPLVFKGFETNLGELGIRIDPRSTTRMPVVRLNCTKCGGPLDLKAPDKAERIWCPNCGSGHDVTQGNLQYIGALKKKKVAPFVELGSTGTFDGVPYVLAGFMERYVKFDRNYYWTEYLLYNAEKSYRWLVNSDGHWTFVTPLSAGDVNDQTPAGVSKYIHYGRKRFKLFQDAPATVSYVLGEFYWKVQQGEKVFAVDYIAAPEGISKEITQGKGGEINYSHSLYLKAREVEQAFGIDGLHSAPPVAPTQPFPGPRLGCPWAILSGLLMLLAIAIWATRPNHVVYKDVLDLTAPVTAAETTSSAGTTTETTATDTTATDTTGTAATSTTPGWGEYSATTSTPPQEQRRAFFTPTFTVSGGKNLRVTAKANVDNSWIFVAGDLVNEGTGALESFEMPIEYYHGSDGGESGSEGDRDKTVYLSAMPAGKYSMRVEAQWDPAKPPPPLHVEIREGVFRFSHFVLAFIALSIIPLIVALWKFRWETQRWKDSSHSPFGQQETDDDEEE